MLHRSALVLAALGLACSAPWTTYAAAVGTKRPLSHGDFDAWRSINTPIISRDGRYLAYSYMPQVGDGDVIVRDLTNHRELRIPAGALPPQPLAGSEADPERPAPRPSVALSITSDSRFVVAHVFPPAADTLAGKRAGSRKTAMPSRSLAIIAADTGQVTRLPGVKSLQIPASGGAWLAYLKTAGDDSANDEAPPKPAVGKPGADLVLRNLATGTERSFANVSAYSWARDGAALVFTVSAQNSAENGIYVVKPDSDAEPGALARGPGRYLHFTWDREETQAVFLSDRDDASQPQPTLSLYLWRRQADTTQKILTSVSTGVPKGSALSGDLAPSFSGDGRKVYVATAPLRPPADPRLATLLDEEKVYLDIWRSADDVIPPLQKVRAAKERTRAYLGILDVNTSQFLQLADPSLATLTFNEDGTAAFGFDDRPYRARIDYDGIFHDLYVVDAATGQRTLAARAVGETAGVRWSPDKRWIAYYANRQWFAVDSRDASVHPLSQTLPHPVFDERADMPEMPPAYGTAGWTEDGSSLLIYDRYDLWQVFPDGRPARVLTNGFGRANQILLRLQPIDAVEPGAKPRGIDLQQSLTFRGEDDATCATGFFRLAVGGDRPPERLLWADKDYRFVGRALATDTLLLTASRFDEFPDILKTNTAFTNPQKVTDGGAQLEPFAWGSDELISYRSTDGVPLSAMLCKPANFDPRKKYPMIVYIYERLSRNVNRFFTPAPLAVIEPSFYTSNGYVVLMPDIVYTTGHPGQSAYRCVMPAVDEVVRRGFVDENAIGLEGHSWGGYETAYLITQTNRFRAAEAGAIVSNMISANGAIGDSSGRSRQFKYEKNQSRIGATISEAPLLYLENSPVFFVSQVNTPLLIMHNDHDDIVPWPQAVEFFLALRREGKEAYLLNYNGDFHSPRRRAHQADFARRMHQFFDHFLKGASRPDWMANGVPFLEREAEALRFRDSP